MSVLPNHGSRVWTIKSKWTGDKERIPSPCSHKRGFSKESHFWKSVCRKSFPVWLARPSWYFKFSLYCDTRSSFASSPGGYAPILALEDADNTDCKEVRALAGFICYDDLVQLSHGGWSVYWPYYSPWIRPGLPTFCERVIFTCPAERDIELCQLLKTFSWAFMKSFSDAESLGA